MPNHHFWCGDRVWLRAIEQKDLDEAAQSFEPYDTDAERYVSFMKSSALSFRGVYGVLSIPMVAVMTRSTLT